MNFELKTFEDLTPFELYDILKLRVEIFSVEQEVLYNDLDDKDQKCLHMMLKDDGKIVGALRLVPQGVSYDDATSIGRLVVDQNYRRQGLARKMMIAGIDKIKHTWDCKKLTISGQLYLKEFYESIGFETVSDVYLEDTLPHVKLDLKL